MAKSSARTPSATIGPLGSKITPIRLRLRRSRGRDSFSSSSSLISSLTSELSINETRDLPVVENFDESTGIAQTPRPKVASIKCPDAPRKRLYFFDVPSEIPERIQFPEF